MTMIVQDAPQDLVVLVADKDMEQTLLQLLIRTASLEMAQFSSRVLTHPARDSGCRTASHDLLRPLCTQYKRALVVFDREGSGGEGSTRETLEREVEGRLAVNGWDDRCAVLALDPELEIWMWTDSPELDQVIGWTGRQPDVRDWLRSQGFAFGDDGKPERPKEALRAALRHVQKQPSSSLFAALAAKAGLARCTDPAFLKLKRIMRQWFPR